MGAKGTPFRDFVPWSGPPLARHAGYMPVTPQPPRRLTLGTTSSQEGAR